MEREREKTRQALARAEEADRHVTDMTQEANESKNMITALETKIRQLSAEKHDLELHLSGKAPEPVIISGKVLAFSKDLGAVVLNVGRDDGVTEGVSFLVYRPGKFVARVTAKTVDRSQTAATIDMMQVEPEPGDECTNSMTTK